MTLSPSSLAQGPGRPLVLYHGDCPDGFGAAFAAWKALGDGADYRGVSHGEAPPAVDGRRVLICDFAYDRETTIGLAGRAAELIVLDHARTP